MSTIDLRHEGRREAGRIANARLLLDQDPQLPAESRGVLVRLRPSRALPTRQCIWVFRITVSSVSGQVVWEPLVTLKADLVEASRLSRLGVRTRLAPDHPLVSQALGAAQYQTLRDLREALRRPVALWTRREQDLMTHMRERHARLSAGLVQRSLFDNRDERLTASQSALLDDALSHSARRLRELDALDALELEACRLAFAAVIE